MRKIVTILVALMTIATASAERWVEATELGIHGQTIKNSKYPYCRFDYTDYTSYKDVSKSVCL